MTLEQIKADFPMLTNQILVDAFENVKRRLRLPPVLISAELGTIKEFALTNQAISIDGTNYWVKEVKEVISESHVYSLDDIDYTDLLLEQSPTFSFTIQEPSGTVFHNNNEISGIGAICNIILYIYPIWLPVTVGLETHSKIPKGLVMPIIAKGLYYYYTSIFDLATAGAYNDLCIRMLNHLLETAYKVMPDNWCEVTELDAYEF